MSNTDRPYLGEFLDLTYSADSATGLAATNDLVQQLRAILEKLLTPALLDDRTRVAAEIHVMGVLPEQHGMGYGRALIERAERDLAVAGVRWLTVKTLAASHPDPHYADTRRFYEAVGFEPLEVFPTLWDEDAACLLMMKPLRPAHSATVAEHLHSATE